MVALRNCSISWLMHSVSPSVCGWYAVDIAEVIPKAFQTSCETLEANWGPRSDMILSGSPNRFHAFSRNSLAVSDAVIVFLHGGITIALENLSTITLMESNPLIPGHAGMKSVMTWSK